MKKHMLLNLRFLKSAVISNIISALYSVVTSPEGVKEQDETVTLGALSGLIIT